MLYKDRNLWELTRGNRLRYLAATCAMGLGILASFLPPLVSRDALDAIAAANGNVGELGRELWAWAGLVVLFTTIAGALQYYRGRWAAMASEGIACRLRDRLYDHLQHLPCAYHDGADTGDLIQRCTSDVETIRRFLAEQVVEIGRALIMFLAVLPLMLWLDARMTLLALAVFPVITVGAVVFFARVKRVFLSADQAEGRLTNVLQENLTGIRVVRAFARQEHERNRFAGANAGFRDASRRVMQLLAGYWAVSDVLCLGQVGVVLLLGAGWVKGGVLSVGTLFAFLSYLALLIWPIRRLGRILADTGKAVVALARVGEILDQEPELAPSVARRLPAPVRGELVFDNVGFAHGTDRVLDGLSLTVAAGETVAILGPPGSGKSTMIHLLLRLYEPQQGTIRVDGCDLRSLDRKQVRAQIAVVLQEPFLYSKSLRENLLLGNLQASQAELEACARTASIHDAIVGFEAGYGTVVGERGVTLSGGQRQRVALARALLRDPAVLVLDDALSAVDTRTEARILAALGRRRARRTTLIIAHRLTTLMHADRIVVLDRGRIVQVGNHAGLASSEGAYRRLWQIQSDLEQEMSQAREHKGAGDVAS